MNPLPDAIELYLPSFIVVLAFVAIGFGLSRWLKRNDIADFLWGLGFIAMAAVHAGLAPHLSFRGVLVLVAVGLWGLRLEHIFGISNLFQKNRGHKVQQSSPSLGKI